MPYKKMNDSSGFEDLSDQGYETGQWESQQAQQAQQAQQVQQAQQAPYRESYQPPQRESSPRDGVSYISNQNIPQSQYISQMNQLSDVYSKQYSTQRYQPQNNYTYLNQEQRAPLQSLSESVDTRQLSTPISDVIPSTGNVCIATSEHIKNCPICSQLYKVDTSMHLLCIVVLIIICLILTKKLLDKKI
jgi:hypothetical protein